MGPDYSQTALGRLRAIDAGKRRAFMMRQSLQVNYRLACAGRLITARPVLPEPVRPLAPAVGVAARTGPDAR